MEGDFAEKLKTVLSDPEALSKITAIASGLGAGGSAPSEPKRDESAKEAFAPKAPEAPEALHGTALPAFGDRRIALLSSIRPLLREDKRRKIDSLTRALTLAEMMKNLRG